jgi:pimeloyl-ACP methyl ester carboxylesterase
MPQNRQVDYSRSENQTLVVILHAYMLGPESVRYIRNTVATERFDSHIITPQLPFHMFSTAEPAELALSMVKLVDRQVEYRQEQGWEPFVEIILIGHSLGALLARKLYVLACGETEEARFEEIPGEDRPLKPRPWAATVTRIILFAAMNRGWSITHHLNLATAANLYFGSIFGEFLRMVSGRGLMIFQIRRGAPFLTNLRLQWIAMQKKAACEGRSLATTVQLLGTVDDLVAPDDNIDLTTGRDFLYLDVPASGHKNVIDLDDTTEGLGRRNILCKALCADTDAIRECSRTPGDPTLSLVRPDVTNVIFVIHGIRDAGYWTQRIARKVEALGQQPPKIYASETSTYGYFPMIPFLLPSRRRAKVEWLMDQYVEAKVLYPNAAFGYVGHSNGTYLLARAFEVYPACRFEHVVFAGSVVRKNYDWQKPIRHGQVNAILNYVATADWVVAWFPGALEILGLQDVGTAGHNGFSQVATERGETALFKRQFLPGTHGAALAENNWDDIAHFIVNGKPSPRSAIPLSDRRDRWVAAVGAVAPLLWIAIVAILCLIGWGIWTQPWIRREWERTLLLVGFIWTVWKILTWV